MAGDVGRVAVASMGEIRAEKAATGAGFTAHLVKLVDIPAFQRRILQHARKH